MDFSDSDKGGETPTRRELNYQTFADEIKKDEIYNFIKSDIMFKDKFQNESRLLKGELYKISSWKLVLYVVSNIVFLGLPLLFSKWNIRFKIWSLFTECFFYEAKYIKIIDPENGSIELTEFFERETEIQGDFDNFKLFFYHFTKYYYNKHMKYFQQVEFKIENFSNREVIEKYQDGISDKTYVEKMEFLFDKNIIAIPEKSILDILIDEILNPFNLFQIFSFIVWYIDDYGFYAVFIAVVTIFSILLSLYEIKQNYKRLKEMLYFQREILVLRNGNWNTIPSGDLVPGDMIQIPENSLIPCDTILLKGSCIVNEAVLTGESIPVPKNPLLSNNQLFSAHNSQQNLLFSGSFCIKTNAHEKCIGLVLQVGFHTYKGQIAKELIYLKGKRFSFLEDSFKYMFFFFIFSIVGFLITLYPMILYNYPMSHIIIRGLELFTIAIPPALPAAMETGIEYSISRLKNQRICSIHPQKINIVGKINFIAFDKTGTLTEEGLDIYGYQLAKSDHFDELRHNIPENELYLNLIVKCFATCHNLIFLDGKLAGDPLDLKMFEFSKWIYKEIDEKDQAPNVISQMFSNDFKSGLSICRIFEFEPGLQRMSVIFKDKETNKLFLSIKGSPEQISTLCKADSLPLSYHDVNKLHAQKGYRVIAIGIKPLDLTAEEIIEISREQAESKITFLGFLVCENKLKSETPQVIKELNEAKINSLMVTGDNPLTAISVAKECKMIEETSKVYLLEKENPKVKTFNFRMISNVKLDESEEFSGIGSGELDNFFNAITEYNKENNCYAVTGDSFEFLMSLVTHDKYQKIVTEMLNRTIVFSRMKPHNKSQLIVYLRSFDERFVLMTGDGANDCVAMKKADIGLSLGQEEASLASDFTSQDAKISSLLVLIKEGRCALCTSINCFKFMTLYSMIQFLAVSILYMFNSDLSTNQYVFSDVLFVIPLAFTMNLSKPAHKLSIRSPIYKLISFPVLFSAIGHICLVFIFQVIGIMFLITSSFYIPNTEINTMDEIEEGESPSYENNTLFLISAAQYLVCALAFCEGKPFRRSFYKNTWFLLLFIVLLSLQLWIDIYPIKQLRSLVNVFSLPNHFRAIIVIMSTILFFIVLIFEKKVVEAFTNRFEKSFN